MAEYALQLSEEELARYRLMSERALTTEGNSWTAAGIVEGASVADVGCGPGAVSCALARLVGTAGRVFAVDRDPKAVEAARVNAQQAGADITFSVGPANETGLEPESVDVVMIRHVLAHNGGLEESIVAHAATLVRPGGSVYLTDIDADATRTRPAIDDLDDLADRYQQWHAAQGNDLSVGLRLDELLASAGLEVTSFRGVYEILQPSPGFRPPSWAARQALVAAGLADEDDLARWASAFDKLDKASERPTIFFPLFSATGRRREV